MARSQRALPLVSESLFQFGGQTAWTTFSCAETASREFRRVEAAVFGGCAQRDSMSRRVQ
jgi:hypothetical protein